jgi:hypothetical protein
MPVLDILPVLQVKKSKFVIRQPLGGIDAFRFLATGYKYKQSGWSKYDLCLHNADIATEAGTFQIAQTWHILAEVLKLSVGTDVERDEVRIRGRVRVQG